MMIIVIEVLRTIEQRRIERKTVTIDNIVSALWSRDIRTIWFEIARTFVSMNKWQIFVSLIAVFLMAM